VAVQRRAEREGVSDRTHASAPGGSRQDRLVFGTLLAALAAGLVWLVHPWYDPMIDASIYISTTRSMLAGDGYSYLGMPFHLRPPGFSLLLAPVLHIFGSSFLAMNMFVAGFGAASLVLLYMWSKPRLGAWLSLLACLVVGTNPVFVQLCNQVMSDVPGTFFVVLSLLVARACERKPSLHMEILLGFCIAASAYVRVLGLMVLPAVLLERVLRHVRATDRGTADRHSQFAMKRLAPVLVATLVFLAPLGIRNELTALDPPTDQLLNYSYSTALLHYDFGDPASPYVSAPDWAARILKRCNEITAAVATRLQESEPTLGSIAISTVVFALFLYSLFVTPSAAGFFILFSFVVTGSYFAFQDRLLLPIFALLVPLVAAALHRLIEQSLGRRWAAGVVGASLLAICLMDFAPRERWHEIETNHARYRASTRALEAELPADARLASVRGFHLAMLLEQPVHSIRWAYRRAPGMAGIDNVIDRYGVNTLVFDPESQLDREYEPAIVGKYGEGETIGGLRVIRVRD